MYNRSDRFENFKFMYPDVVAIWAKSKEWGHMGKEWDIWAKSGNIWAKSKEYGHLYTLDTCLVYSGILAALYPFENFFAVHNM